MLFLAKRHSLPTAGQNRKHIVENMTVDLLFFKCFIAVGPVVKQNKTCLSQQPICNVLSKQKGQQQHVYPLHLYVKGRRGEVTTCIYATNSIKLEEVRVQRQWTQLPITFCDIKRIFQYHKMVFCFIEITFCWHIVLQWYLGHMKHCLLQMKC